MAPVSGANNEAPSPETVHNSHLSAAIVSGQHDHHEILAHATQNMIRQHLESEKHMDLIHRQIQITQRYLGEKHAFDLLMASVAVLVIISVCVCVMVSCYCLRHSRFSCARFSLCPLSWLRRDGGDGNEDGNRGHRGYAHTGTPNVLSARPQIAVNRQHTQQRRV